VRPTSSRVREALFSLLGQDLSGLRVLDAYGGSGLLSFEALSRGAQSVTVCERNGKTAAFIKKAGRSLGVEERMTLRIGAVPKALPAGSWDLALLDPPYGDSPIELMAALEGRIAWRLVLEQDAAAPSAEAAGFQVLKRREYGGTALSIYAPSSD